jgi:polyisoprenoid-binding protein YceI
MIYPPLRYGIALGAALTCAITAAQAQAAPATYDLDPEHTTVAFLVGHIGYAKVLGRFTAAEGSFVFDETTGELSDLAVTVTARSVSTDHEARDEHLQNRDFLNVDRFPDITFAAMGSRRTAERTFEIEGELTLLGTARRFTLEATVNKSGAYPIGDAAYVLGVSARGRLQRSEFGMTYGVENGLVGNEVDVIVEVEARRRGGDAP